MAILAILIIITLILESRPWITPTELLIMQRLDFMIWLVFTVNYILRFLLAKDKLSFFKSNIIDLLSILPFDNAFQGLRSVRIIQIFYLFRVFVYLTRVYKRFSAILNTNSFNHVLGFTLATILGGRFYRYFTYRRYGPGRCLVVGFCDYDYFVGYGDIVPSSLGGRLVAVVLMLVGIGLLSMLTKYYFIVLSKSEA